MADTSKKFRLSKINRELEKLAYNKDFLEFLGKAPEKQLQDGLIIIQKNGEFLAIPQGNTKAKGIFYIDSFYGQDGYSYDKKSTSTYWVLSGSGEFTVNGVKRRVKAGDMIVVPDNTIFYYSGDMQLVEKMEPNFEDGNVVQVGDPIIYPTVENENN